VNDHSKDFWIEDVLVDLPKQAVFYKLTDNNDMTHGGMTWGNNVSHYAPGCQVESSGKVLDTKPICSSAWIHVYRHPVLAMILNRVHADFFDPNLWACSVKPGIATLDYKVGCKSVTTEYKMDSPKITLVSMVCFAIRCAMKTWDDAIFQSWGEGWLKGTERIVDISKELASVTASLLSKIQTGENERNVKYLAIAAAHSAAGAAVSIGDTYDVYHSLKHVEFLSACAAVYANKAAYLAGEKIDLIKIIETVMAAE
jgi:hypothetical protein